MRMDKPIKILSGIALGAQALSVFISIIITIFQDTFKKLMASPQDLIGIKIFPWASIIPGIVFLVFIVALVIVINKGNAKGYKIGGIVIAIVAVLNRIADSYLGVVSNMFASRMGANYIATNSILSSAISMVTSPFTLISTALFFIVCGMCICYGVDRSN